MNSAYKIFRSLILSLLVLALLVPVALFFALSTSSVQNKIRSVGEQQLSELLGTEVTIGELEISPFNRLRIGNVAVIDNADTILKAEQLGVGINLNELAHRRLALNYVEIAGLEARLSRDSVSAPLNIDPIIARLKKPDDGSPKSKFELRINTVVIRNSRVSYDILDAPATPGRFNPAHIAVADISADINLPTISDSEQRVNLRRLSFTERSGFTLSSLSAALLIDPSTLSWKNLRVQLPKSEINFADLTVEASPTETLEYSLANHGVDLRLLRGSNLYLPDLKAFAAPLGDIPSTVALALDAHLSKQRVAVAEFRAAGSHGEFVVDVKNLDANNYATTDSIRFSIDRILVNAGGTAIAQIRRMGFIDDRRLDRLDGLRIKASADGTAFSGSLKGNADINDGTLDIDATYNRSSVNAPFKINANILTDNLNLAAITGNNDFDRLNANLLAQATLDRSALAVDASATVTSFRFRDNVYDDITANLTYNGNEFSADAIVSDAAISARASISGSNRKGEEKFTAHLTLDNADLHRLGFIKNYPDYRLSLQASADLAGNRPDRMDGYVNIHGLTFVGKDDRFRLDNLTITSASSALPRRLEIASPYINGSIEGDYDFRSLPVAAVGIFAQALPELLPQQAATPRLNLAEANNNFTYDFRIERSEQISQFFHLPVEILYPAKISGRFDGDKAYANLDIDLPYISQKDKLIRDTRLQVLLDGKQGDDALRISTLMPTKNGEMGLNLIALASDNNVLTDINWTIDNEKRFEGTVSLNSLLGRSERGDVTAQIDIRPGQLVFNDSVWTLEKGAVTIDGLDRIDVDNLNAHRANQFVKIDGSVSKNDTDTLKVDVLNLSLDYLFETLAIENVMLGGDATGQINASSLLSGAPHLVTDGIHVKDISYNGCRFGNAVVKSHWDNEFKAVALDGLISQYDGHQAHIAGEIFPLSSELDLRIHADHTPVGFMHKYMGTFADDISGFVSGDARLWGNFHDIDLVGNIFADNLRLKLIPTNTYYTATDSIHIEPGVINLSNITLRDRFGNTAMLNGQVRHEFFRDPTFDIAVTDATNLLAYEQSSKENPDWYGTVYVNGGAIVKGVPGLVKVTVNASTAPKSIFTFVLSTKEVADDYTFLTFRDKSHLNTVVTGEEVDLDMKHIDEFIARTAKKDDATPSDYVIEFNVNVTPQAEIDLVMDPVSGDKIRAHGSGDVRMVYTSKDNDLRMYGTYTLDRGTYNFTLQDIIIKEFTINPGSSVTFTGDPMAARLDINAYFGLNANLNDLDESFSQDRDLNRTNVPVHAVLMVKGDINQPEISFDLAFPTLTSDVYRKVRSIVSTDEMMNRQILYLLALNRFYTPDYMGASGRGSNELFSVASTTLTSQLSNILGQLSDNWAISPNLRSDRGDFSDVEVDVALSSRLLNNRLLFNGNFGYRDKSLNTNQFIGDFDLEYLLNQRGTIRLKAYSHFNDQNYYVRTAQTTQGAGVAFKLNFDSFLDPFRLHKSK